MNENPSVVDSKMVPKASGDIATEIRDLFREDAGGNGHEPAAGPAPQPPRDAGPGEALPAPGVPRYHVNLPLNVHERHRKHAKEIQEGRVPAEKLEAFLRAIPHIKKGIQAGCICWDCCMDRGQIFEASLAAPAAPSAADEDFSAFFSEEMIGDVLCLPYQRFELECSLKNLPKDIVELWRVRKEQRERWGRNGKRLFDHYVKLPNFRHKELILFALSYLGELGVKYNGMQTAIEIHNMQEAIK